MTRRLLAGLLLAAALIGPSARAQVTIQPPATGSAWALTYPTSPGTSGYVLSTDGTGITSWISNTGTASSHLSGLTAAAGTNTINNTNYAQTWQWGTLSTQTAMTLTTSSMTTGKLLSLSNTSTPANAGTVLSIANGEAGASYGLGVTISGAANTGYAGYFINTDTSGANYGIYAVDSGNVAIYGLNSATTGTGAGVVGQFNSNVAQGVGVAGVCPAAGSASGVKGENNGAGNSGYGVYGLNAPSSNGTVNYGGYFKTTTTAAGYGIYGKITGAANTGYAGYFINTDTSGGTNYGVYSKDSSTTATAGNFNNSVSSGNTVGLYGESDSTGGTAAYFVAKAATGSTNGIYAQANSTSGIAASFNATATSGTTYGVHSVAASTGTFGAGNFNASASSGTTYGLYSTDASASGYGGYFTNSTSTGIALFCSSTLSTGCGGNQSWNSTSDARLKDRITDLLPARGLDAIMRLRPVTYRWKDKKMDQGGQRIGLIAQQVEPVYPEIVGTDSGGMKSIGYSDLTVPLIKAVTQLQDEVSRLKADNDILQHEIDALETGARR